MDRFEHQRHKRMNPGHIVFEVVKGASRRVVLVPEQHAARETAFVPKWPIEHFDGTTIRLKEQP